MQNVLVIDDTSEVRSVVVTTLAHFGFATREAADGRTGIQLALAEPPDLIICDVRMPGMDGYQTLIEVRNRSEIAATPFIFLTAATEKHDVRRGMGLGADDYLAKPFKPEDLLEAVTTRLARQAEVKSAIFKREEKLRESIVHLLSQELAGPLHGIIGAASVMMHDYASLKPESMLAKMHHISESAQRLDKLAKSLS